MGGDDLAEGADGLLACLNGGGYCGDIATDDDSDIGGTNFDLDTQAPAASCPVRPACA